MGYDKIERERTGMNVFVVGTLPMSDYVLTIIFQSYIIRVYSMYAQRC